MRARRSTTRRLLLVGVVLNMISAIGIPAVMSLFVGFARMSAVSRFDDFYRAGVINRDKLRTFEGGRFAVSWSEMPLELTQGVEDFETIGWLIAALALGNAIMLGYCVWSLGGVETKIANGP